jgi:hypothetical protein
VQDVASSPAVTTAYEWRRFIATVLAVALVVAVGVARFVTLGRSSLADETGVVATYTYTCCSGALVDTVYHPGEVMVVHWIRSVMSPATSGRGIIVLSARLSGPFASVEELKSTIAASPAAREKVNVVSSVTRVSNVSGARPATSLPIPQTATPGYYNVFITIGSSPVSVVETASSIVRIAR